MDEQSWQCALPAGVTTLRVYVADTDAMGVVYNGNYLTWFEIGRTELLRERGLTYAEVERRGYSLPVTEATFKVRRPARYDDLVTVETRVAEVRSRTVRFVYRIHRDGQLLVEGDTVHVPVKRSEGRSVTLPDWIRDALLR